MYGTCIFVQELQTNESSFKLKNIFKGLRFSWALAWFQCYEYSEGPSEVPWGFSKLELPWRSWFSCLKDPSNWLSQAAIWSLGMVGTEDCVDIDRNHLSASSIVLHLPQQGWTKCSDENRKPTSCTAFVWIFNRSYILLGFFFSCLYISGDPKKEFRCPSRLQTSTNQFRQTQSALWSYGRISKSKHLEYSCLTSWNLDCQHASTQSVSFFRCTSFFGRLVSALFKSIYGVDSRGLCFGGRLGTLLTLITVKMDISLLLTGCKHRSTISGHGMNALQCLKGKRMWIQARKVQQKKASETCVC